MNELEAKQRIVATAAIREIFQVEFEPRTSATHSPLSTYSSFYLTLRQQPGQKIIIYKPQLVDQIYRHLLRVISRQPRWM